ncbi:MULTISPECIES: hypothetical protein [Stappiaceae]|uniref:hypothetical protein n=1 Tax=Stappiaceae TaxID=2821832 RepID=UPI0009262FEE|nr:MULTISPECIES: hypothetical protein [Stappiaceae]MBO9419751.1 hypothetical protein [Labrenzia sp. R4_2]OJJ11192.1 hypothetical protein BKI51_15095 [Alphaproteobacteria bacterium AO1-B]
MPNFVRKTRNAGNRLGLIAVGTLAFALSACQIQSPSDILFAPTYNTDRGSIPVVSGTQYDCRTFQGSGWKGIAGGRAANWGEPFPVARTACFKTRDECQAFLTLMSGYIDYQPYYRCQPHTA